MHGHLEARRQLEQALDAAGERAAVPVVEEPAGVEDEREIGVRKLGGFDRLQGGDEARPAEGKRLAVQIAGARVLGGRARPLQPALAVETGVREAGEEGREPGHLVEDRRRAFVVELAPDVEAEPGRDPLRQLARDPPVGSRRAGRR